MNSAKHKLEILVRYDTKNEYIMRHSFLLGLEHAMGLFGCGLFDQFDIKREIKRLEDEFGIPNHLRCQDSDAGA